METKMKERAVSLVLVAAVLMALTGTAFAQDQLFWDGLAAENTEHTVTWQDFVYAESEFVAPVNAYDGAIVTIVDLGGYQGYTGKTEDPEVLAALEENEIYIGDDSLAAQYLSRGLTGSVAVVPAWADNGCDAAENPCCDAQTLKGLARLGFDVLDGSFSADETIYHTEGVNHLQETVEADLRSGWDWYIANELYPVAFVYPCGYDETVRAALGNRYDAALRVLSPEDWPEDTPYGNSLAQDRMDLRALHLRDDTADVVKAAIDGAAAEGSWLILGTDALGTLSAAALGEVLDYIQQTEHTAYLTYDEALQARYGGVRQMTSMQLFTVENAPAYLNIGGVLVDDYNAPYQTEAGSRFSLYTEEGTVLFRLESLLQEDLTIETSPLLSMTPMLSALQTESGQGVVTDTNVTIAWTVSSDLTYSVGAANYEWVCLDAGGHRPDEEGFDGTVVSAGYATIGSGSWGGSATVTLTVTNPTAGNVVLQPVYENSAGITGSISAVDPPAGYDANTMRLTVAGGETSVLTLTIGNLSGDISAATAVGSLTLRFVEEEVV